MISYDLPKNVQDASRITNEGNDSLLHVFVAVFLCTYMMLRKEQHTHDRAKKGKNDINTSNVDKQNSGERQVAQATRSSYFYFAHLVAQPLLESAPATTTSGSTTPPTSPSSPPFLHLFSLITLATLTAVTPSSRPAKLIIQGLLVLLYHRADLIGQYLRQLLSPRQLHPVEYNDSSRLIQRGREFLMPDHTRDY